MGMTNAIRVQYEPIREVDNGDIAGIYTAIGTPFLHAIRMVRIVNTTNADVFISYDGSTDHDIVPQGGFVLYDYGTNKAENAGILEQAKGTQPWVRLVSGAASSGSLFLIAIYAAGAPD